VPLQHAEKTGDGESPEQTFVQAPQDTIDDAAEKSEDLMGNKADSGEVTQPTPELELLQALEDITADGTTVESDALVDDVEHFENSEEHDVMPFKRKSLLNRNTGEEEYFHPDDESDEVEVEGCKDQVEIEASKVEDSTMDEVDECTRHSSLSTAATSQTGSGASTPRTSLRLHCNKTRFERQGPMHVADSNIRSSQPPEVARSLIFSQTSAGGRFEYVSSSGSQALTPGSSFREAQISPILRQRSVSVQSRSPLVHASPLLSMLPRSSTPTVVFRSLRSQSVVQECGTIVGSSGFACQVPGNPQDHVIKNNSFPPPIMPVALGCRTAFSLMTSAGSSSPMRLSCPPRVA